MQIISVSAYQLFLFNVFMMCLLLFFLFLIEKFTFAEFLRCLLTTDEKKSFFSLAFTLYFYLDDSVKNVGS